MISFLMQMLAHSAGLKKGVGIGATATVLLGLAYASSSEYADKRDAEMRAIQEAKWKAHEERGDIILQNLNTTLGDMKSTIHTIDQRTFFLYKREIEKRK